MATDIIARGMASSAQKEVQKIKDLPAITNDFILNSLSQDKGEIANITVDKIDTSDKIHRYLTEDLTDINFFRVLDQNIELVTAEVVGKPTAKQQWTGFPQTPDLTIDYPYQAIHVFNNIPVGNTRLFMSKTPIELYGSPYSITGTQAYYYWWNGSEWFNKTQSNFCEGNDGYRIDQCNSPIFTDNTHTTVAKAQTTTGGTPEDVHLTNKNGELLYWVDNTHTAITLDVTLFPIMTYEYIELTKMHLNFERVGDVYIPKIILGVGDGVTTNSGKAEIYKGETGLELNYYKSTTGDLVQIKLNDDGITVASTNTDYDVRQIRNSILSTADASGGSNGDIWFKYTP